VWGGENETNDGGSPSFGDLSDETGKNEGQGGIRNPPSNRSRHVVPVDDSAHALNGHAVLNGAR